MKCLALLYRCTVIFSPDGVVFVEGKVKGDGPKKQFCATVPEITHNDVRFKESVWYKYKRTARKFLAASCSLTSYLFAMSFAHLPILARRITIRGRIDAWTVLICMSSARRAANPKRPRKWANTTVQTCSPV